MTMEIYAPQPLVRLPRTTKVGATTHFGSVFTVRDGVKRRRKEICAATDGDSLSIYEAQNGNILTSFPVPPNSSFSGPPCSIRVTADGQLLRRSYCAIKLQSLHIQLVESHEKDQQHIKSVKSPELHDQQSPLLLIDVLPHAADQVLVIQQNGNLTTFSTDLGRKLSDLSLRDSGQLNIQVLAVQHLTPAEARKSVLNQRSDILNEAKAHTSYLALAYTKVVTGDDGRKLFYGIWSIETAEYKARPERKSIFPLLEHELGPEGSANDRHCNLGHLASHLYLKSGPTFSTYNLSGLVPTLASTLHTGINGGYEIMAISPAFAICSFQDSLRLYDLRYQSLRLQIDAERTTLKRKRSRMAAEGQIGPVEFVTYLSHSARIIGRRRHYLVAIDISTAANSKRELQAGSKLIQNIGLGVGLHDEGRRLGGIVPKLAISASAGSAAMNKDWLPVRRRLDELAQAGDVAGFEEVFVNDIRSSSMQSSLPQNMVDDLPSNRFLIPDVKINYLLCKIFQIVLSPDSSGTDHPADMGVKVQVPTFRLIAWLSRLGLVSYKAVKRAMSATNPGSKDVLSASSIVRSLVDVDSSLSLLTECLETGFSPYVEEQAGAVQVLLQQALALVADAAQAPALDETEPEESGKQEMQIQALATSTSDPTWLPSRLQRALIMSLDRFGAASAPTISTTLRGLFSQREVLALIQFLRQQLFQGGHTRSFQSVHSDTDSASLPAMKLDAIVKVLSSCIDAIGPLGFIGALENEDFVGNIIPDLVTEITHATQSLEDAAELQGTLRETLRYEESIRKHKSAGGRLPVGGPTAGVNQCPGTIVTLYSEDTKGDDKFQVRDGLPLSLRAENVVNPLKARKGGGPVSKRSVRHMNMMESMSKGQYSFERLVL
ncbi:hypothetical protein PV05_00837 [Exophiala xenobiotica]|uniref:Uncharacterized protein n=1 Tax=Exophiala xenobiotica TaxID=348802 RepID=A0A0D2C6W1_9EURO|nr:uncharacterized protein PV05_00837 [Exophiala xenobiotica]KIW60636.1 hypothetical protein PV05_00837 [Exophiala xenobiotica]